MSSVFLETLTNATANLPMYTHYYLEQDTIHSSSDGQKYASRFDTINARHSSKYFGLEKGVVVYTLVINHIPVNAKIISTHQHESHYVFDLLYNNLTNVKPQIHSTDTDGTNRVNFAILDLFGYQFAPRHKQFSTQAEKICGFQNPNQIQ